MCISHQEFQQSVGPIDTVNHFIHVLHWSLPELLHHEENIDEQSAEDLKQAEKDVLLGVMLLMGGRLVCMSSSPILCYLQRGQDGRGDNDEKPEVHVEELTDHVGHVGGEDQQEEAQRHCSEMLP